MTTGAGATTGAATTGINVTDALDPCDVEPVEVVVATGTDAGGLVVVVEVTGATVVELEAPPVDETVVVVALALPVPEDVAVEDVPEVDDVVGAVLVVTGASPAEVLEPVPELEVVVEVVVDDDVDVPLVVAVAGATAATAAPLATWL